MLRTRLIALFAVTALVASAAGCGGSDDSSDTGTAASGPDKVKVGVIPIVDVAPIYLGKAKGFFTKQNIDLTLEQAQGGAAIVPAVVSGQYQFGFSNVVSLMLGQSKNVPIKAVANGNNATADPAKDFSGLVVKDPAITRPKDLEGKTVASNTLKNIVDTSVKDLVRKDGGDPSKVKFVEIPFPDMSAALDANRVQAIFVVEPFLAAAKAKGWKTIGSFAAVSPNLQISAYFTSTQLLGEKADLAKRFTAAMKESLTYAAAHPDEVRQIVTTYTTIKAEAAAAMTLPGYSTEIDKASLDTLSSILVQEGLLTAPADTAKLVQ
ncbi:NitT/TauT family transport system substrate-binding protein [Actinoplanes tereljensis]|uniref:Sulfonate ABC transporter substrate-binding protein n=1 Tax=Paractinoplanes tereljensis TaxID=571912 RepID=A0A919NV15_9ACTN|nr:ABC transporter substrate-binding protein [Actinoplanes tereljensis]GIF24868.1 sulfonate ABC transporter substrate-binding protein [Actinoplanes tereljensis]